MNKFKKIFRWIVKETTSLRPKLSKSYKKTFFPEVGDLLVSSILPTDNDVSTELNAENDLQ